MAAPRHVLLELDEQGDLHSVGEESDAEELGEGRNAFDQTCIDLQLESAPEALRAAMARGRMAASANDPSLLSSFPFQGSGGRAAAAARPAPVPGPAWAPPASARRTPEPVVRRRRWSDVIAPDPERAPTETTSKFWGVAWDKSARRWKAEYTDANHKRRTAGYHDTEEAAAHAVNAAIGALPPDDVKRHTNPVVGSVSPEAVAQLPAVAQAPSRGGSRRRANTPVGAPLPAGVDQDPRTKKILPPNKVRLSRHAYKLNILQRPEQKNHGLLTPRGTTRAASRARRPT